MRAVWVQRPGGDPGAAAVQIGNPVEAIPQHARQERSPDVPHRNRRLRPEPISARDQILTGRAPAVGRQGVIIQIAVGAGPTQVARSGLAGTRIHIQVPQRIETQGQVGRQFVQPAQIPVRGAADAHAPPQRPGDSPKTHQRGVRHGGIRLQIKLKFDQGLRAGGQRRDIAKEGDPLVGQLALPAPAQHTHRLTGCCSDRAFAICFVLQKAIVQEGIAAVGQRVDVHLDETRTGVQAVAQTAQSVWRDPVAAARGVINQRWECHLKPPAAHRSWCASTLDRRGCAPDSPGRRGSGGAAPHLQRYGVDSGTR